VATGWPATSRKKRLVIPPRILPACALIPRRLPFCVRRCLLTRVTRLWFSGTRRSCTLSTWRLPVPPHPHLHAAYGSQSRLQRCFALRGYLVDIRDFSYADIVRDVGLVAFFAAAISP